VSWLTEQGRLFFACFGSIDHQEPGACMRVLIATAATLTLAAAAAAGMALHSPPSRSAQRVQVSQPAPPAEAVPGMVWRSGTATLRLTDRPCPSEEFTRALESEGVSKPRAYDVTQGSRRFSGCWSKDVDGDVVTMEPGRDIGSIPIGWFQPGTGG
jgi:hypothetical protein